LLFDGFPGVSAVNGVKNPRYLYSGRTVPMHRILIVDDSATIRKMVRVSLQTLEGPEFVEAASGLEAIEQLAVNRVELIVLDLNMPDMHGVDVLKFVRRQQQYQQLPIIVLTTRDDDASRRRAEEAGATTYLTKPFVPQTLAATARQLLTPEPHPIDQV
jgi:two-component system chemotaxis response regulator CheY